MANNNGRKGWLTIPIAITIFSIGMGALWRTFQIRAAVDTALDKIERVNIEGTLQCKAHALHDAKMTTQVENMQTDLEEVKGDMKDVKSSLQQQMILLERISTKLESQ